MLENAVWKGNVYGNRGVPITYLVYGKLTGLRGVENADLWQSSRTRGRMASGGSYIYPLVYA